MLRLDPLRGLDAIDLAAEADVHEDEVGLDARDQLQRLLTRPRHIWHHVAHLDQRVLHIAAYDPLVFND